MNKEQLTRIKERIIKIKASLGDRQTQFILYGSCALLIIFILTFTYRPLAVKLQHANRELNTLEAHLLSQRSDIAALKDLSLKGRLMRQKEASFALDEITRKGRALGLRFVSITPGKLQRHAPRGNFKVLPIAFQIEAAYKNLGQFLAYLEESFFSIAEVKSFSLRPREKNLPKLNVKVLVHLYMEAEDAK